MNRTAGTAALVAGLAAGSGPSLASQAAWSAAAGRADAPHRIILSDEARGFLTARQRSFPHEFLACMIGDLWGGVVVVRRIAFADVDSSQAAATWVVPRRTCESAGWSGTVGMVHSHPTAERCWYFFPETEVPSSDGVSFLGTHYPVDAILCGDRLVWVNRALVQRALSLTLPRSPE